jgi:hypothetical protein
MDRKKRIKIPEKITAKLIVENRRRCCICREPRRPIQIHHIDSNPSNNEMNNLAVLCIECHSNVSGNQGFGKSYSVEEVKLHKQSWELRCKVWLNEDVHLIDEPIEEDEDAIDSDYFQDSIESGTHFDFHYNLLEGQVIIFGVLSDNPIDIEIMRKSDYEEWLDDGSEQEFELGYEEVTIIKRAFVVPEDDDYVVLFINNSSENAEVQADISIWNIE